MRSYENTPPEDKEARKAENERLLKEFLKNGGQIECVPYGVTSQPFGSANPHAFYNPPSVTSPLAYKRRLNKAKKK